MYSPVLTGLYESPKMTHEESLIISKLEDMVRAQIGVKYPTDPQ